MLTQGQTSTQATVPRCNQSSSNTICPRVGTYSILAVLDGEIITTSEAMNIIISSPSPRVLAEHLRWAAPNDATVVGNLWAGMSADDERELLTQGWSPDSRSHLAPSILDGAGGELR